MFFHFDAAGKKFPELHGKVRFDHETLKGSVRDTVRLAGFGNKNASRVIQNIKDNFPELFEKFCHIKINGTGRATYCASVGDLIKVVTCVLGRRVTTLSLKLMDYFSCIEDHFWKSRGRGAFSENVYNDAHRKLCDVEREFLSATSREIKRTREHDVSRDRISKKMRGTTEVDTGNGLRCDVVTQTFAIEVKETSKWHHAVGQALVYGKLLNKKPAVHFYDKDPTEEMTKICGELGIKIIPREMSS
ncbi:hypothetical protein [Sicyoidochytrium minutum DNA virus]|nr:hypothetical protein [Sicyoidochytrium minutum DNA virus]